MIHLFERSQNILQTNKTLFSSELYIHTRHAHNCLTLTSMMITIGQRLLWSLQVILLLRVVVSHGSRFKGQTGCFVFRSNAFVVFCDLLEEGQMTVRGSGNSLRLAGLRDDRDLRWVKFDVSFGYNGEKQKTPAKTHHLWRLTITLGNSIVQVDVVLRGLSYGLGVLRLVAQSGIEARLVSHILHGSDLLPGIDVGECSTDHTISIRDFTVCSVDVTVESSSGVRELVRVMGRRRRCRLRHLISVLVQVQVGDIGKGNANGDR